MSETAAVVYLEADDEVTSVVRRLRAADPGPVVIVAPGRSRATSSVVALRLLGRAAAADGRPLRIVGDALTRSLAAEAGVPAFATLDEARRAGDLPPALPEERRHAAIHVVRGPAAEETAPTLAAVAATSPSLAVDEEATRPVPVARPHARRPERRAVPRWPSGRLPLAAFGAIAALLIGGVVAGATILPAATVTIVPRTDPVGPVAYTVTIEDPERNRGTATATAEVVASGEYRIQEPATGTVVFFNWTFFPVDVPAGTFVAAGEQAFATQADVTVPRGRLTGQGTIAAGDAQVAVVAAAPGPAANVPAEAINVILDESLDDRLGGVPENPQPRVLNPAPTSGGLDESGPEITQADVDAVLETLRADLAGQVAEATAAEAGWVTVVEAPAEAVIEGVHEGLVGTRDEERVELRGSQDWEVVRVERDEVVARAEERFLADGVVGEGREPLAGSIAVTIGMVRLVDGAVEVEVTVAADAASPVEPGDVVQRILGRGAAEAEAALADFGTARVELWPGWVTTVPTLEWRVEVRVAEPEASR